MKYLKYRYIFTLAIVLILGITLTVYFFGGLKASALDSNNLEFSLDGYIDYSSYDGFGKSVVEYSSEAELNNAIANLSSSSYDKEVDNDKGIYRVTFKLNNKRIVAQNKLYTMFLDENTTIVSIAVNSECTPTTKKTPQGFIDYDIKTCKTVYATGVESDSSSEAKSNFILKYVGSNNKLNPLGFNTYAHSVLYNDLLYGTIKRHYKMKFVDDGVEILYEIGDFTLINSFFPKDFDRNDMENYFLGNLAFTVDSDAVTLENRLTYSDLAYTWSAECAAYLEKNNLATVEPDYRGNVKIDENGNRIPSKWNLTNILEEDEEGRPLNRLKMKLGVDYNAKDFNTDGASPCIANPFMNSYIYDALLNNYYGLVNQSDDKEPIKYQTDWRLKTSDSSPTFRLNASGPIQFRKMFEFMYKEDKSTDRNFLSVNTRDVKITGQNINKYPGYQIGQSITEKIPVIYDENPYDAIDGVDYPIGGFQARDEEGNFLFTEDGKPVQKVFKKEYADVQNDLHNNVVESTSPIFQVAMKFSLTDKGLNATILNNSLREGLGSKYKENGVSTPYSHDCFIGTIDILPHFTSNDSLTSEGQIILPDGSGAVINFNSEKDKLNYRSIPKPIYGADKAFVYNTAKDTDFNEKLMFGMYGFLDKTSRKGVLAIVDRGANQNTIYADFKRENLSATKNIAYFQALLRASETVYVGNANTPFLKWSKGRTNTDFSYIYQFLPASDFIDSNGKIQYVTLAKKYREYLIHKYNLSPKDMTDNNVLAINFLGSFDKKEVTFGFSNNKDYSLTTFEQAKNIITQLQDEGVENFSIAYTSWTKDAMETRYRSRVNVSSVIGGSKGIKSFAQFLEDNEIDLYPEVRVATNKGYDYSFGDLKYTSKGVGSNYAHHYDYGLATNVPNKSTTPITMVSPTFYQSFVKKFFNSYRKLGVNGAYISDLGNMRVGDYSRNRITYAENGMDYQIAALSEIKNKTDKVMLSAPFDYALQFADFAVNVPLESSFLGYYDYSIPFYQLVVSGLFDYAGPAVNFNSDHVANWYLLKALETGSNLYFMISAEDTINLLDTDYTMYFNTYYANWKNQIIRMNNIINETGIHYISFLSSHKILKDNVYEVEYSNGVKIIINYQDSVFHDENRAISVRPNWFAVIEEGK